MVALACSETDPGGSTQSSAEPEREARSLQDPVVRGLHERMRSELDGDGDWSRVAYLEFDWVLLRGDIEVMRRSYRFSPIGGDFRVETEMNGRPVVVLGNGNDPSIGRVWLAGEPLTGDTVYTFLARAVNMLEADAYELLMPYLWTETGVSLRYLGRFNDGGQELEAIELTFEDFRDDQEPKYRIFLDPESGVIVRLHQFRTAADTVPASVRDWEGWTRFGPIRLATVRKTEGGSRVEYRDIRVEESVPRGRLTGPGG